MVLYNVHSGVELKSIIINVAMCELFSRDVVSVLTSRSRDGLETCF